jgi:hypothetical protein
MPGAVRLPRRRSSPLEEGSRVRGSRTAARRGDHTARCANLPSRAGSPTERFLAGTQSHRCFHLRCAFLGAKSRLATERILMSMVGKGWTFHCDGHGLGGAEANALTTRSSRRRQS